MCIARALSAHSLSLRGWLQARAHIASLTLADVQRDDLHSVNLAQTLHIVRPVVRPLLGHIHQSFMTRDVAMLLLVEVSLAGCRLWGPVEQRNSGWKQLQLRKPCLRRTWITVHILLSQRSNYQVRAARVADQF
jgi:hypothetical protein